MNGGSTSKPTPSGSWGKSKIAGTTWVSRLGVPRPQGRAREHLLTHADTVALYRHRYDVDSPTPLGDAREIKIAEQAAEDRVGVRPHGACPAVRRHVAAGAEPAPSGQPALALGVREP